MRKLIVLAAFAVITPAVAHTAWSNGDPVPEWTKKWCCGPADVHKLEPGAVHIMPDGYHIDGLNTVIPMSRAIPSPDGAYWAFFRNDTLPDSVVYCFYSPLNGV